MTPETPKHGQQRQVKLKAKDPKPTKPAPPKKGLGRHPDMQNQKFDWMSIVLYLIYPSYMICEFNLLVLIVLYIF